MSTDDAEPVEGPRLSERVAQICIVVSGIAVLVTLVGLAAIAANWFPYGRMLLTGGIGAATVSLIVVAAASAWNKDLRTVDAGSDDDEDHPQSL